MDSTEKAVYLTFDDGPNRTNTTVMLNNLLETGTRATFFVLGNRIKDNADLVQREHDEGHAVASHNYTHGDVSKMSGSAVRSQKTRFDDACTPVLGISARYARVPYGLCNDYIKAKGGMPLIQRIVTISGDVLMEPKNLLVPIGTSFEALIDACGYKENPYKVLSGGPMMGAAQYDLSVPTIKGVNAITVLGASNKYDVKDSRCLRCGKCIDACPMKLMPVLMYKALQSGEVQEMKDNNIMDCIECGSCAYTCPASVPLVLGFRVAKQLIRNDAAKQAAKK